MASYTDTLIFDLQYLADTAAHDWKRQAAVRSAVSEAEKAPKAEAVRVLKHVRDDGKLAHGDVRLGDTVVMLSHPAGRWPVVRSHVHVYVPDVDVTYARALAAGAEAVQAPAQKGDEDKRGGFRDPGGTTWWIATQVGNQTGVSQ